MENFPQYSRYFRTFGVVFLAALSSIPLVPIAHAADGAAREHAGLPISQKPKALDGVGIIEKLGTAISIDSLKFRNEAGAEVMLSQYFRPGKPVVLSFAYYNCPGLCGVVLNGITESVRGLDWKLGERYELVNVSIDAKETSKIAADKKASYVKNLGRPEAEDGWHFLTGTAENIQRLTQEIGFGFRWVPEENQFAHGAGIFILTPAGKLSRILYGIQYRPSDLKLSLLEASNGKIGTILDRIILFCYQYDPQLRQYSLGITRVVQLGAILTTLLLLSAIAWFWFSERRMSARSP